MNGRIRINEQNYITIFIVFVHICVGMCLKQQNPPVIYKPSGCVSSGGLWYILPSHFGECTEACLRQTKCLSVNYNRISTLCILRDTEEEPTNNGFCYHVVLRNLNFTDMPVSDPCKERPCNNQSVCESSSSSSGEDFTCRMLYCDSDKLPTMPNARIQSKDSTKLNNTNAYICHTGYTMYGDSRIGCLSDGNWSSINFTCYKNCPPNLKKTGSTVLTRSQLVLTYNAVVAYACKAGYYTFENPNSQVMTCKADGSWTDFDCLPYCTQAEIPPMYYGAPVVGTIYTIREKARYTCDEAHYLSPSADTIACRADGTWEVPTVKCWTYCTKPTVNPTHSVLTTEPLLPYIKGMTVTFTCSPSDVYYLDRAGTVATCTIDGTWNRTPFKCNRYCGEPPIYKGLSDSVQYVEVVRGGGLDSYTTANSVTYTCLVLGNLDGNDQKRCNADGTWSGPITCCFQFILTCCTDDDCYIDGKGK